MTIQELNMNKSNLFAQLRSLSRKEKLEILLFLTTELAQEEVVIDAEVYLEQLRNSPEAANQLMQLLESEKQVQNV